MIPAQPSPPAPWRRYEIALLAALLATHLGLLVALARRALGAPFQIYEPLPYLAIGVGAVILAALGVARFRSHAHAVGWLLPLGVAFALAGPGPTLAVAVLLLTGASVGRALLGRLGAPGADLASSMATGLALAIGVLAATASLKLHFLPVYATALLGALALTRRACTATLADVVRALRTPAACSRADAVALVLLCALAVLHVFVAARPEAGYDANTMHLQLPLLLAQDHRFRFDVTRQVWAVMPLGADWLYGAAYLLGGESATRFANLAFGALALAGLYALLRRAAPRWIALLSLALFASTPLAFLETGSLLVENLWLAFLLGSLVFLLRYRATPKAAFVLGFLLTMAGALQCKALALVWLAPVGAAFAVELARHPPPDWRGRATLVVVAALAIAVWPYADAWVRTGNPLFPFFNGWFRSPYFAAENFGNELYRTPLTLSSFYDVIIKSGAYVEGRDGAAGLSWLLLLPPALLLLVRGPMRRAAWAIAGLAASYFVVVYSQQAVLRYLLPSFALVALLGGWGLAGLPDRPAIRAAVLVLGTVAGVLGVRLVYTASWVNAELCPTCAFEAGARERYLERYMPDKLAGDTLNRILPGNARVGFFMPNAPVPAGYLGYSRLATWHDYPAFEAIALAEDVAALDAVVARFALTHVVCRDPPEVDDTPAIREYCATRITPVWRGFGRVAGRVQASARSPGEN